MNHATRHHFGIGIALFFGLVTAVAATLAVFTQGRNGAGVPSDLADDGEDILGI